MLDVTCYILCEAELVAAHKLTHNNRVLSIICAGGPSFHYWAGPHRVPVISDNQCGLRMRSAACAGQANGGKLLGEGTESVGNRFVRGGCGTSLLG